MAKRQFIAQSFLIDKLTNSIENVTTGDRLQTEIALVSATHLKPVTKKNGWEFDWKFELKQPEREVYKLTIQGNPTIIQGLMSLEVKSDHVYLHLIESAPFNRGSGKMNAGVPGNLVAFACRLSFQRGFQGAVSFLSKSKLVQHYERTLGAFHFGGRIMVIETAAAKRLIERYFKGNLEP